MCFLLIELRKCCRCSRGSSLKCRLIVPFPNPHHPGLVKTPGIIDQQRLGDPKGAAAQTAPAPKARPQAGTCQVQWSCSPAGGGDKPRPGSDGGGAAGRSSPDGSAPSVHPLGTWVPPPLIKRLAENNILGNYKLRLLFLLS